MAAQREWYEKDYYKVLGVKDTDDAKAITKAYRKLARDSHPDTHPGDDAAEERFKEVSAAYDVLGDDAKRKEYDEVRRLGPSGFPGGPGGGPGGYNFNVGADGLGDLLGQVFNRGRRGGGASASAGPQRGADVEATLTLDFIDAAKGITTTLYLTSDAQCSTCNGSGAKPGTQPKVCSQCGGRGVVDDNQGFFSFSSPCRACGGGGVVVEQPCPTCRGSRVERRLVRCRRAFPPVSPTARRSASRGVARRVATAGRRATSSSSARSPRTRSSGATATTSRCACRSRSPRPRWAATSTCPRWRARGSRCACGRVRSRAAATA
jgi:DnaJ-class molecular chaperone